MASARPEPSRDGPVRWLASLLVPQAGKQNGRCRKQFAPRQNNGRRAFAQAQADARFVKRSAAVRIKRFQRVETGQDKLGNEIHAGDENDIGQSAPDERRALLKRAQAGNARGGNALHRARDNQTLPRDRRRETRAESAVARRRKPARGGRAGPAPRCWPWWSKAQIRAARRERNPKYLSALARCFLQRGGGEKKGARIGVRGIGGAKVPDDFVRNKTGDHSLAGFADDPFAPLQGAGIRGHGALQSFHSPPGRGDGTAAGDGNSGTGCQPVSGTGQARCLSHYHRRTVHIVIHGCFQRASQVFSRSSMKGGQFKISSPAGVVKTWLVLPVTSSAPSAVRRIS